MINVFLIVKMYFSEADFHLILLILHSVRVNGLHGLESNHVTLSDILLADGPGSRCKQGHFIYGK